MDMHALPHGIHAPVLRVHEVDQLLNENGGLRSDDVGSEDRVSLTFDQDLDEVVLQVHRLALRGVLVSVEADQDIRGPELLDGLRFLQADARELGVSEPGMRTRMVVNLPFLYHEAGADGALWSLC